MELLQFPFFPLLLTFLFLLYFWVTMTRSKPGSSRTKLPPSPWKLPIIGNIHQMLGGLPHHIFRDLSRKHGSDLMHLNLGQIDLVVISSSEAAKEIMKDHDLNFSSRSLDSLAATIMNYGNKDILFAPYGSYWRELRKICISKLLSVQRIKAISTHWEEEISELVHHISTQVANHSPVNLTKKLVSFSNSISCKTAFGAKCKQEERYISLMKKGLELGLRFNLADLYPSLSFFNGLSGVRSRSEKIHRETDEIIDEMIKEHQMKKGVIRKSTCLGDDRQVEEEYLVDALLRLQEEGDLEFPFTITNTKAVIMDMLGAGTDTISSALVWAMVELARHPMVMKKVQSEVRQVLKGKAKIEDQDMTELHYMKLVIKETLRLHPPVPLLGPRICTETCRVMGCEIPAQSRVVINAWSIGRDPRYWEDGESFSPERFDESSVDFKGSCFEYLPFGGGRRMCPGISYGMAILELTLANLLLHFDWELPKGVKVEDLDMSESFGIIVAKKLDLCLIAKPGFRPLPTM